MASVWEGVGATNGINPAPVGSTSSSPQDIQQEVKIFLQGATCQRQVPVDTLAQSALFLLQRVPAARNAVLEHFSNVFDEAAGLYIRQVDSVKKPEETEHKNRVTVLQEVTRVLFNFINTSPDSWAPIVSSWSFTLLGQISNKYAGRRAMTMTSSNVSFNDVLQLWMTCPATKMLMDLATECFASMVGGDPDSCVKALLEASVKHTPHFDWVVARIGSCYPTTIITRVLHCGLKDFCSAGHGDPTEHDPGSRRKMPKMESVKGILEHLAYKHQQDIRKALMALFEEGLQASGDAMRMTTVPFLLELANKSSMLLKVLTTDLISALTPSVLNRLHHQFMTWNTANPGEYSSFLSVVVHLVAKCEIGAFDILNFIISTAVPPETDPASGERVLEEVQETCVELTHMLLFELQRFVYGKRHEGTEDLHMLEGLTKDTDRLVSLLLQSTQSRKLPWLEKILVFTAVRTGQNFAATVLSQIIMKASNPAQLALYFHLQENIEKSLTNVAKVTVNSLFGAMATCQGPQLVLMLRNLEHVVRGEYKRNELLSASENFLTKSIQSNLHKLCDVLEHPDINVNMAAMRLLRTVGVPLTTNIPVLSRLSGVIISVLFRVMWACQREDDDTGKNHEKDLTLCHAGIRQVGCQAFSQSQMLYHLLHGCIEEENAALFGGKVETSSPTLPGSKRGQSSGDLLSENRNFGVRMALPPSHARIFHAGVIGQGLKPPSVVRVSKEKVVRNQDMLLEAIAACCQSSIFKDSASCSVPMETDSHWTSQMSNSLIPFVLSEMAACTLGCSFVEAVTMDTLYNDVNWPDTDFLKYTLERDMYVWKTMEDHPVLWSILRAASTSSVFLYYTSMVLKSLMAKLMRMLELSRDKRMSDLPDCYQRAWWLIQVLAQGKVVPAPMCNIGELFPFISCYEGYRLLLTVWRFIRDYPPLLSAQQMEARKCEPHHTKVLHAVLNANIHTMGHLYPRIFNT